MSNEILAALIGAIVGGFLSAGAGVAAAMFMRRRSALDSFIAEVTKAVYLPLDDAYHRKSAQEIRDAVVRLRPYISDRCFTQTLDLIAEYQRHNPEGFDPHSLEYNIFCIMEGVEPRAWAIAFSHRIISKAGASIFEEIVVII
jgi:hypothetical protein